MSQLSAATLVTCCARLAPAYADGLLPSHRLLFRSPGSASADWSAEPPHARLDLVFHDIAEPREGLAPPIRTDIEQLLAFADGWTGARPMLVNCYAAISRSPAAAYAIACLKLGAGAEARLAQALRRASPSTTPNAAMVALADEILQRGGRMTEAIVAIGRGADAYEGEPFAWDIVTGEAQSLAATPNSTAASQSCSTAPSTSPV